MIKIFILLSNSNLYEYKNNFFRFLIFLTSTSFGQNKEFDDFTNLSDSLMHKAYKEKNPENYLLL